MTEEGVAAFSPTSALLMCAPFPDRRKDPRARPPAFDLPSPHTIRHPLRSALDNSTQGSAQVLPDGRPQPRQPEYSD